MKTFIATLILAIFLVAAATTTTAAQTNQEGVIVTPDPFAEILENAVQIGSGTVTAYQKEGRTFFLLPSTVIGHLVLWYAEAASLPPEAKSISGVEIGRLVVTFEKVDNRLLVRDHTSGLYKRAGNAYLDPFPALHKPQRLPIQVAINDFNKGPVVTVFPILAEDDQGNLLVDITQTFINDIESLTAKYHVMSTGMQPGAVDPDRSYISRIKVFNNDVDLRSHLTFLATNPGDAAQTLQPVSIEVGHSFVILPPSPMAPRAFDGRVGFFKSDFMEYESATGKPVENKSVILRWRLEKSDPTAAVSPPVKPIVFYISREVPERWRPYIRAGVEQWQPAFEAAGFKDAIIAKDAPTKEEDPHWSPEDARHSVIRWVAQSWANAIGPNIYDPRSGEILAAHIQIWPQVLNMFERYYFAVVGSLDPEAGTLPMAESKQGQLLQYIVAHEVGHAIGLRHNHLASTAYSVSQMRNPSFANIHGPNASIMAYGRFNQVAQPEDGVTEFLPKIGPYDYFAIKWGYGIHGETREEETAILQQMALKSESDRRLMWAAGEMTKELETWLNDPRLQKENTGAERIESTRLAVTNLSRSLEILPNAVGENSELYRKTLVEMVSQHTTFLQSVTTLIGGRINQPQSTDGPLYKLIPPEKQKEAIGYLLTDGARSLDQYKDPFIITRIPSLGGIRAVETLQSNLVDAVFSGPVLARLDEQKALYPGAYGPTDLAEDIYDTLWQDLSQAPRWKRALQRRFLELCQNILAAVSDTSSSEQQSVNLMIQGYSKSHASLEASSGVKTDFPAWATETLRKLHVRLKEAGSNTTDQSDRYHFQNMMLFIEEIVQLDVDV